MADEALSRILDDHDAFRRMLPALGHLARRVRGGEVEALPELRGLGLELHRRLGEHLALEDRTLVPALEALGAEGGAVARRLREDHAEQRLLLEYILARLEDGTRPAVVVGREITDFVVLLDEDIEHEERHVLWHLVRRDPPGAPRHPAPR